GGGAILWLGAAAPVCRCAARVLSHAGGQTWTDRGASLLGSLCPQWVQGDPRLAGVTESGHGRAPAYGSGENDGGSALLSDELGRQWATVWGGRAEALECGEWTTLGVRCGVPRRPEPPAPGPWRRELCGLAPSSVESPAPRADLLQWYQSQPPQAGVG